jgi:hypothetical protein
MTGPGRPAPVPDQSSSTQTAPPPDIPRPPDQAKWDDAAEQFQLDVLSKVQASAAVWSGAIGTLLGLFGSVALVTGPNDISKFGPNLKPAIIVLTVVAGICAAVALVLATTAQQLPSVHSENWNGTVYRAYIVRTAETARQQLNLARILGVAAADVVFIMGVVVLIAAPSD